MTDTAKTFEFTLVTLQPEGMDFEIYANRLFEAGCDDALVSASLGLVFIDYERAGCRSLGEALDGAEAELCRAGVQVERAEPDDLVTLAEMSRRSGFTREALRLWAKGERGDGRFPVPRAGGRDALTLWSWAEVSAWLVGHVGSTQPGTERWRRLDALAVRARVLARFNERLIRQTALGDLAPLVADDGDGDPG